MSITAEQVIKIGRRLDDIIPELANLCGIYTYSDLPEHLQDKLICIYHIERKANVYGQLDALDLRGSTTFLDLENAQSEFAEWAQYDLDRMIEDEWLDESGLKDQLAEVDLDNKWRNGDLFHAAC